MNGMFSYGWLLIFFGESPLLAALDVHVCQMRVGFKPTVYLL